MIILVLLLIAVFLIGLWLFMIAPRLIGRKQHLEGLAGFDYAHRGLHDKSIGIPENSLAAFARAVENGYGMELDVHRTLDGKLIVLHDSSVERMCGVKGNAEEMTWDQLRDLRLLNTGERIPLFSQVLSLVNGKVPLIVQIKAPNKDLTVCRDTYDMLKGYLGAYCVESFNPYAVRWFKKNAPHLIRGQLTYFSNRPKDNKMMFFPAHLLTNVLTRPDFIAFSCDSKKNFAYRLVRALYRPWLVSWTVRSQQVYDMEYKLNDIIIFEAFRPVKHQ